jgi:hypothetical protein
MDNGWGASAKLGIGSDGAHPYPVEMGPGKLGMIFV